MRIAYLDCFAGISGDMFLGALLGAGVPLAVLDEAASALDLGAALKTEIVDRSGISSIKVHVLENGELAEGGAPHSHAHDEHAHRPGDLGAHSHEHEHSHEHGQSHKHNHGHEPAHTHRHEPPPPVHAHPHPHEHPHSHEHEPHAHVHGRSLSQIRELIEASHLKPAVKQLATATFELLGRSEAKVHNVPVESIHFHEVGAVDAIVDIVASCAGIVHLGSGEPLRWYASPVNVGGGMVVCAHGTFPVPAPATADLLRGMPTYAAHIEKELVTPTGAALLRALEPAFGQQPAMIVDAIGYGAGSRNPKQFPNVLRLSLGQDSAAVTGSAPSKIVAQPAKHGHQDGGHSGEMVTVLETALDDTTPQILAHVAERALASNALDVMLTPVIMKKGRPGTMVTVLCNSEDAAALEDLLLRETSTLGVRMHREHRTCLERHHVIVTTDFGDIRVKVGVRGGEEWNAHPEFEDCRAAAAARGVAVKQVMQAAMAAYTLQHSPTLA